MKYSVKKTNEGSALSVCHYLVSFKVDKKTIMAVGARQFDFKNGRSVEPNNTCMFAVVFRIQASIRFVTSELLSKNTYCFHGHITLIHQLA